MLICVVCVVAMCMCNNVCVEQIVDLLACKFRTMVADRCRLAKYIPEKMTRQMSTTDMADLFIFIVEVWQGPQFTHNICLIVMYFV